jgi:hypothetical protein
VDLSAHGYSFYIPGSAFAALTAAGIPTNLPLAGQSIQVRRWQSPYGFSGLPFRQRDWGLRSSSGDNRLAPIGPGYSKNVCLSDKDGWHGGSSIRAFYPGTSVAIAMWVRHVWERGRGMSGEANFFWEKSAGINCWVVGD